jgi:hypothetical protein
MNFLLYPFVSQAFDLSALKPFVFFVLFAKSSRCGHLTGTTYSQRMLLG